MNVAVIDIGTNTVLLLVAEISHRGAINPLLYEQRIPRLGRGVDAARRLEQGSIDRAVAVLREYVQLLPPFHPTRTVVCGTSALRDASNRSDFMEQVKTEVGLDVEVLSGEDEALLTYRGAVSGLPGVNRAIVLDIGGGSTEISVGDASHILQNWSLDVGSVRLTERFLKHDPPLPLEIRDAIRWFKDHLGALEEFNASEYTLVGVAGTATTLAILDQELEEFGIDAVTNYRLTRDAVERLLDRLKRSSHQNILQLSPVMKGRADIITAGTLILSELLEILGQDELVVSERGVRYGIALREWENQQHEG